MRKNIRTAFSNVAIEEIMQLLESETIDLNDRDPIHGLQTCLMRLCHLHVDTSNRALILSSILRHQPDVNIQDSSGRTALAHACIAEKTDIIERLSEVRECDPNIADSDGNTPLMYAVKSRKPPVVEQIILAFKNRRLHVNHINNKGKVFFTHVIDKCF